MREQPIGVRGAFYVETINSKHEILNPIQYQITKIQMTETALYRTPFRACEAGDLFLSLEHSSFEFVSDFDLPAMPARGLRVIYKFIFANPFFTVIVGLRRGRRVFGFRILTRGPDLQRIAIEF